MREIARENMRGEQREKQASRWDHDQAEDRRLSHPATQPPSRLRTYALLNDVELSQACVTVHARRSPRSFSYILFLISQQPYKLGITISVLKMKKLRLRS